MILTLFILSGSIALFIRSGNITFKSMGSLVFIGWIWAFVAPKFIPAFIPNKVVELSKDKNVIAYVRKPYFVEEALNKKISLKHPNDLNTQILKSNEVAIFRYHDYVNFLKRDKFTVLHKWSIWRRRTKTKQILDALTQDNISSIRQHYVLIKAKDNTLD
jgi:hypothetical protein